MESSGRRAPGEIALAIALHGASSGTQKAKRPCDETDCRVGEHAHLAAVQRARVDRLMALGKACHPAGSSAVAAPRLVPHARSADDENRSALSSDRERALQVREKIPTRSARVTPRRLRHKAAIATG